MNLLTFLAQNAGEIVTRLFQHLQLTLLSIVIAAAIGVPLGVLISYRRGMKKPVMGVANVVQAIPSIALLGFLIPLLGIGEKPAIFMVVVYSLLPIIKNTVTGLSGINAETLEAAKGIGMTRIQVLTKVKLPLALPVIMAGVRISAVTSVGLVTLTAFVGANGLGYLIYSGIRTLNEFQILAGAIPACLLALLMDLLFSLVEKLVTPACFKQS
jgi:osmoprotectant transport system permease protein